MPFKGPDDDGHYTYRHLALYREGDEALADDLLALKKRTAQDYDELCGLKKMCERNRDIEGARFFRDEVSDKLKELRALRVFIPMFVSDAPKDCTTPMWNAWPRDLERHLDMVALRIYS